MVSIDLDGVGLTYRLRSKFSLALSSRHHGVGDRITEHGRSRFVTALEGLSLSLRAGDRLGLIGRNGAGKTTLLNMLYGIYEPTKGNLRVSGRVDALFNINLGFRREATGRRNIILRGLINGWSKNDIERRMEDIIAFSELGEFIDMPLKTYSRGMSTRLAFSVATALDPEILLMDEWIGAGDPQFQEKAALRMRTLADNAGIVVLASHNYSLLKRTCTMILELERGRMKSLQSVEDWDPKPAAESGP